MIDVKRAVQIAREKAAEMLDESSFNLEEIERENYKEHEAWAITLSTGRHLEHLPALARFAADPLQYKRFFIDANTGEFLAMKLREVASR